MRRKDWQILLTVLISLGTVVTGNGVQAASRRAVATALQQNVVQVRTYADSDPGNYGYAKYLRRINYDGGNQCTIQVRSTFEGLSAAARTSVINQTQALAKMVLVDQGVRTKKQVAPGLVVTIRAGHQVLGQSRSGNYYRYTWHH
ncbi:hypothetical protein [Limosilactobacillus kribbianus]|uniref:hypothetical protein n=1 Tax=Limosilactobacillus kribbianus TaxID=2982695 RepID=UPI0022655A63|nr:hypothetical protein [Limosilactobacillus kribbianus]